MTVPPLRVLVVDDEPLSRRALRQLLDLRADIVVVAECSDSLDAQPWMPQVDAVLLDIEMPGPSGLDVARSREAQAMPALVFVTAFDEYAVPAFATDVVDYLTKPVSAERLDKALGRVREHVARHQHVAPAGQPVADAAIADTAPAEAALADTALVDAPASASATTPACLSVRTGRTEELVPISTIDCVEADGVYAAVYTGGKRRLVRHALAALDERLPAPDFMRVHRSWIVQRRAVRLVRSVRHAPVKHLVLHSGVVVPISRRRVAAVLAWLRSESGSPAHH